MDYSYLIGYTFAIKWDNEDEIEEYRIVSKEAKASLKEVSFDTPFVRSLFGRSKNERVTFTVNGEKNTYTIINIKCPNFEIVCKERDVKHLYHFTPIQNLNSIMEKGLLSINQLKSNNINYVYNDSFRLEKMPDFISCSVEFPNSLMLNYYKKNFGFKYAILEIDIDVLNYKFAKCCRTNAATYGGSYIEPIDKFNKLFEGERNSLPKNFTTDEQAEILIKDCIEIKYITNIIFESENDEKSYLNKYKTFVNADFFNYRTKYLGYKVTFKTKNY